MKDFKDNLDEESINEGRDDRFASSKPPRTFAQKGLQVLSRYSLLIIVGLAALSITVLHFQGKYLLQALRGTPLPTFWLEKVISSSGVPDKTEVYEQALADEAKEAWQKRSRDIAKPQWQASYQPLAIKPDSVVTDTTRKEPLMKKRHVVQKKKQPQKKSETATPPPLEENPSFFQPVKAVSSPAGDTFLPCVVHGDQEVSNRTRVVLRLTESGTANGQDFPAGTLVYGMARLAQDRLQITVSRIGQQPVSYQVHDHTYHEGIAINEQDNPVQDAAQETVYRQGRRGYGRRGTNQIPTAIASDLARSLLQRSRRQKSTLFLPDGYPLYLSPR